MILENVTHNRIVAGPLASLRLPRWLNELTAEIFVDSKLGRTLLLSILYLSWQIQPPYGIHSFP